MKDFHTQLSEARKASGMTQEQVAEQVHVSRQTVSHWETGRAVPDAAMKAELNKLFPQLEQPPAEEIPKKRRLPGWLWLCVLGAACIALVIGVRALLPSSQNAEPAATAAPAVSEMPAPVLPADYPLEWYQTARPNDAACAYVSVTAYAEQLKQIVVPFAEGPHWAPNFSIAETNGIPFTLTRQTIAWFDENGSLINRYVMLPDEMSFYPSLELRSGQTLEWGDLFPASEARWYCTAVEGVDARGNELAFGGAIELLDELEAVPALSDFTAAAAPQAGKAFMTITADKQPIRFSQKNLDDPNDDRWECCFTFANQGESAFTVSDIEFVYFNGEAFFSSSLFSGEALAAERPEKTAVFQPGESMAFETFTPLMDITHLCLRINGTDADGEAMSFPAVFELVREPEAP